MALCSPSPATYLSAPASASLRNGSVCMRRVTPAQPSSNECVWESGMWGKGRRYCATTKLSNFSWPSHSNVYPSSGQWDFNINSRRWKESDLSWTTGATGDECRDSISPGRSQASWLEDCSPPPPPIHPFTSAAIRLKQSADIPHSGGGGVGLTLSDSSPLWMRAAFWLIAALLVVIWRWSWGDMAR